MGHSQRDSEGQCRGGGRSPTRTQSAPTARPRPGSPHTLPQSRMFQKWVLVAQPSPPPPAPHSTTRMEHGTWPPRRVGQGQLGERWRSGSLASNRTVSACPQRLLTLSLSMALSLTHSELCDADLNSAPAAVVAELQLPESLERRGWPDPATPGPCLAARTPGTGTAPIHTHTLEAHGKGLHSEPSPLISTQQPLSHETLRPWTF